MKKRIKTLRARYAIWTATLFFILILAFSAFVYFSLSINLKSSVDNSLAISATQIAESLNVQNGQISFSEPLNANESNYQDYNENGISIIVMDKNGTILQATGPYRYSVQSDNLLLSNGIKGTYYSVSDNLEQNDNLRVYYLPVLDNENIVGWVQVIQSLGPVQDALEQLITALILGGGVLLIFAASGAYYLASRALKPIDQITQTARKIASGDDLSARLNAPDNGDEVSRLSFTFDEMLARLENSFNRERQFTSDASHELRTPLAAMQTILSVIRQGDRPIKEYHQAFDDLSTETNRMRSMVEDLLRLARGEHSSDLHPEQLDLSVLLTDVSDSMRPLAEAKGLKLTSSLPPSMPLTGDLDALIRLFVNLLDNAIKYTENGAITIKAIQKDDGFSIEINDTGIGISPTHLPRIFDRFYRADLARSTEGTGLGLAIASQIVRLHGGKIEVQSSPGQGSTFKVFLPGRSNQLDLRSIQ